MDHQNVSFKAVLKVGDDNSEIRRFIVDRDVSTSLDYLREKLSTIFSELRRKDFRHVKRERKRTGKREREREKRERERGHGRRDRQPDTRTQAEKKDMYKQ
jgi:hypothetical protein